MVCLSIDSILEEGIDPQRFVTKPWTSELRTTPIKVLVKDEELELMPALKIEAGVPSNKIVQVGL